MSACHGEKTLIGESSNINQRQTGQIPSARLNEHGEENELPLPPPLRPSPRSLWYFYTGCRTVSPSLPYTRSLPPTTFYFSTRGKLLSRRLRQSLSTACPTFAFKLTISLDTRKVGRSCLAAWVTRQVTNGPSRIDERRTLLSIKSKRSCFMLDRLSFSFFIGQNGLEKWLTPMFVIHCLPMSFQLAHRWPHKSDDGSAFWWQGSKITLGNGGIWPTGPPHLHGYGRQYPSGRFMKNYQISNPRKKIVPAMQFKRGVSSVSLIIFKTLLPYVPGGQTYIIAKIPLTNLTDWKFWEANFSSLI